MGKKSKTKAREMQQMSDPNLDLMTPSPPTPTTQTSMSYATAVRNSETETTTVNSEPKPATRTIFGGMRTKGDGSHNPTGGHPSSATTQHPVSPSKIDDAGNPDLGNKNLPRSPSPTSDPLRHIKASLKDFGLPGLTESSESDGESHLSTFKMSGKAKSKAELLAQQDARFIRQATNDLNNVGTGLTKMIPILYDAISETEDNLRHMRRTAKRLDDEVRDPDIQVSMYADLSDVMIKAVTRMLHAFWAQVQKLESHLRTISGTLIRAPWDLRHNVAEPPMGRKNRRRRRKGGCPDDKQSRDPATSTHPTDKTLLTTGN